MVENSFQSTPLFIEREVWPRANASSPSPVRQSWVLTFPNQGRSWLLRSPELFNEVITIVVDSISFFAAFFYGAAFSARAWQGSYLFADGGICESGLLNSSAVFWLKFGPKPAFARDVC